MNTTLDDGGPAFVAPGMPAYSPEGTPLNPGAGHGWAHDPQPGMSLRDWFAGMALQGFFACPESSMPCTAADKEKVTRHCYIYADAMLAAKKEQP